MSAIPPEASRPVWTPSGLVSRFGARTLVILAVLMLIGFGFRAEMVFDPLAEPGDDALAYRALAESLYEEGTYGGSDFRDASDWSPGAPLIFAAGHFLIGGVNDGFARGIQAVLGTLSILIVFLLGWKLSGRDAPTSLLAAGLVAIYPPFIHSTGALMSEPAAIFTLPAAILAFLWADEGDSPYRWLLPGFLFGLTCLIRPEYLFVSVAMAAILIARVWVRGSGGRAIACGLIFLAAAMVPIAPWTAHNQQTLGRFVPITTGSGKALYVGTYLSAGGEYQAVKADLLERFRGRDLEPGSKELDAVDPAPLFDRAAAERPGLSRDEALGAIGKENLQRYVREDPLGYGQMLVEKGWRMWSSGVGDAMSSTPGRIIQVMLVLAAIGGAVLLGRERRWEVIPLTVPIVIVTAIGILTLAPPRRNEILMTLILALAALGITALLRRLADRPPARHAPGDEGVEAT